MLVVDPRLPSAPKAVVSEALQTASKWIETWYRKRVRFRIDRTESVDSYLAEPLRKLPVLNEWRRFSYSLDGTDTVMRFLSQQSDVLRALPIDALRSYVPASIRSRITTPEQAALNLLLIYDEKYRLWKSLRTPAGMPFFDTALPMKHSYWHWERVFETVWPDSVTDHLIVTNVMLLDDALSDAPPHSLLRGGLLNGFSEEECPQAIVSTFPIFTDFPAISDLRDSGEFTKKDRLLALSHIIAHEFGAHVVEGLRDVYDHEACLAVPTSGLAYQTTIRRLFQGKPCRRGHPKINRAVNLANRYENLARRYLEIKEYGKAKAAVERAIAIDPKRPLVKLMLRQIEKKLK
ncbi:MAG: hypothetical protein A3G34_00040 [Candidatus Lindowbacteria bacterium RIFCSPLOWO2_12_FULL_62_27]|nr:MAG: hypothetical protein A3G34_00040 [Candidatus Lindowbacteria bacterium RIFCSPLOWO2_12_FULL_62_27]OGH62313.1 MAG: hypothetical protein A3I06_01530 [Candidatus Lindowbacteria bacterium RIFCSPLOWO2_02_FULL_62_12]